MYSFSRAFVTILVMVMLLSGFGCSATVAQKGLVVSGEAIIAVGNQFVGVATVYQGECKPEPRAGMEKFCAGLKAFAPKFQVAYPEAVATWKSAVSAGDTVAAQGAQVAILTLATELSVIAADAVIKLGGN